MAPTKKDDKELTSAEALKLFQGDRMEYQRQTDENIAKINDRLASGETRMGNIETALSENTAITRRIESSMAGIVAFSDDLASGARIICRLAKSFKFIQTKVIKPLWMPCLIIYLAVQWIRNDGNLPDWAYKLLASVIGI